MVTMTALVSTVANSTLSWAGCNYVVQTAAESVLQCKRQFARSGQFSEFHVSAPQNAAPCTAPPGGVVVSGVRRMNEVNARRARLVPGWVTVFGRVYRLGV